MNNKEKDYEKIPLVLDTPVPFYEVGVSCGLPKQVGVIPPEMALMPCQLASPTVFMTYAKGDSMEGVHIHNRDMLFMDNASRYYNHDVVLARVDGEEFAEDVLCR
jgi:SOS-response transcriptional repressor LexA